MRKRVVRKDLMQELNTPLNIGIYLKNAQQYYKQTKQFPLPLTIFWSCGGLRAIFYKVRNCNRLCNNIDDKTCATID